VVEEVQHEITTIMDIQKLDIQLTACQARMDALRSFIKPNTTVIADVATDLAETTAKYTTLGIQRAKLASGHEKDAKLVNNTLVTLWQTHKAHLELVAAERTKQYDSHRMLIVQHGAVYVAPPMSVSSTASTSSASSSSSVNAAMAGVRL